MVLQWNLPYVKTEDTVENTSIVITKILVYTGPIATQLAVTKKHDIHH